MNNKYLEGCKKLESGLYRLRESIQISKDSIVKKTELTEKLTENINGIDLPIFSTYLIKLWAKDSKNKNKRNYSKVFNKILQDNKVTIGFMDHPKQDGDESYRDVVVVCRNPQMIFDTSTQEEWLAVEVTLVGKPYGENCEAVLQAGGFLEFSSSALGDVDANGFVLENGFFLERYADVVVNSSNGQLFFINKEEPRQTPEINNPILYDVKHETISEKEELTIYNKTTDGISDNNAGEKTMSDKLNEKALELNIKSLIRDAERMENLFERKQQLEVAKEYAQNLPESTLISQIEKSITEADNSISELAEKGKSVESLTETIKTLSEEATTIKESISALQEEKTKLQENYDAIIKLYEDKQYEASQTELLSNKKLSTLIESLKEEIFNMKKELVETTEKRDYFEALSNSKIDADEFIQLKESVKNLTVENKSLKEKNVDLLEDVRSLRRNVISERTVERKERPVRRFETRDEEVQYNDIMKEELQETVTAPKKDSDNVVSKILSQKGFI